MIINTVARKIFLENEFGLSKLGSVCKAFELDMVSVDRNYIEVVLIIKKYHGFIIRQILKHKYRIKTNRITIDDKTYKLNCIYPIDYVSDSNILSIKYLRREDYNRWQPSFT